MTEPRVYKVQWDANDQLKCLIIQATGNRFAMRVKSETSEERLERKAREAANTPQQNLANLLREHHASKWRATELYPWFEQHAPGYIAKASSGDGVYITFAHVDHAVLFKLTWT